MRKNTGEKQLQAIQPIRSCYSPLKAPPSTSTGQYRPWQQIPESNLELNRLLNTRNLLIHCENQQKALVCARWPALDGLRSIPLRFLPSQEFSERESFASPEVFWRPCQNGRVSINVMRTQEWPPSFPHLCRLSLRQLQGMHSLLNNSLLRLVLCPLFLPLCFIPLSQSYKFAKGACFYARSGEEWTSWEGRGE